MSLCHHYKWLLKSHCDMKAAIIESQQFMGLVCSRLRINKQKCEKMCNHRIPPIQGVSVVVEKASILKPKT